MKKLLLTLLLVFITSSATFAQEWLTSFAIAKRLALSQNKMILAVWEDTASYPFPMVAEDENGKQFVVKIFENDSIKELIWKHFVPVIIREAKYEELSQDVIGKRSARYIERFNDEYLKVMDPNGNIINVSFQDDFANLNLSLLIRNYSLNVALLKPELNNYFENKNFSTTFRLGKKYLDVSIYANKYLKKKIADLSDIYMSEAKDLLVNSDLTNIEALKQKFELLEIQKLLILSRPKKAFRLLKKYNPEEIDSINKSLFAFLNFTTYRYLKKIEEALVWQDQVSQVDLKKVKFIIK